MTTRLKTFRLRQGFGGHALAAIAAMIMLAGSAPLVLAQDQPQQQQRRRGPGGPGAPGMGGPMRGPGGPMGFRGLDLTDDQQAQLRKIREARQAEFKAAGEKLHAAREGMRALIEAETLNEGAIRAKAAEVAAAEADFAILNARVRQESLQVLTSEQQQKLKEFREQRGAQERQRKPRGQ